MIRSQRFSLFSEITPSYSPLASDITSTYLCAIVDVTLVALNDLTTHL